MKPNQFEVGQWVLYFNPRKFRGKQNKWIRQYEGPFLVIATPSSVTARIQKSTKAKSKTFHIDKLKAYLGKPPKKWTLPDSESDSDAEVESSSDEENNSTAKVGQTQHLNPAENSSLPNFSPIVFSDGQNVSFEVRTPEVVRDRIANSSVVPGAVVAELVNSASCVAVDSASSIVVESPNSTSSIVVDKAEPADEPSKQSSIIIAGEQGRTDLCDPTVTSLGGKRTD